MRLAPYVTLGIGWTAPAGVDIETLDANNWTQHVPHIIIMCHW